MKRCEYVINEWSSETIFNASVHAQRLPYPMTLAVAFLFICSLLSGRSIIFHTKVK